MPISCDIKLARPFTVWENAVEQFLALFASVAAALGLKELIGLIAKSVIGEKERKAKAHLEESSAMRQLFVEEWAKLRERDEQRDAQLRAELESLRAEHSSLRSERDAIRVERDLFKQKLEEVSRKLEETENSLRVTTERLINAQKQLDQMRVWIADAQIRAAELESRIERLVAAGR